MSERVFIFERSTRVQLLRYVTKIRSLLSTIRSIPLVNRLGRNLIKLLPVLKKRLAPYWPVSGKVRLRFGPHRFYMLSKADDGNVNRLYYKQELAESVDLEVFMSQITGEMCFYDIGANTGIYTLIAKAHSPGLCCYAFEPHPANFQRLQQNIALNACSNTECFQLAVGSRAATIDFAVPVDNRIVDVSSADLEFSQKMYEGTLQWKSIKVEQTSLDQFRDEQKLRPPDLMKIDVENYELEVLEGAKKSISTYKPMIILESFPDEKKSDELNRYFNQLNYTVFAIGSTGLVHLPRGFAPEQSGLNYFLRP